MINAPTEVERACRYVDAAAVLVSEYVIFGTDFYRDAIERVVANMLKRDTPRQQIVKWLLTVNGFEDGGYGAY